MALCDKGYLCRVCGEEVEHITDSELYLRFVIGEVDPETLHTTPECHLRCSPAIAQFIEDERFGEAVQIEGPFAKAALDSDFVAERTQLLRRGYERLWQIRNQRRKPLAVVEYPLQEFLSRWS